MKISSYKHFQTYSSLGKASILCHLSCRQLTISESYKAEHKTTVYFSTFSRLYLLDILNHLHTASCFEAIHFKLSAVTKCKVCLMSIINNNINLVS